MRHEMLTQRALFAIARTNTKRGTLSQHFVTHVVHPLIVSPIRVGPINAPPWGHILRSNLSSGPAIDTIAPDYHVGHTIDRRISLESSNMLACPIDITTSDHACKSALQVGWDS